MLFLGCFLRFMSGIQTCEDAPFSGNSVLPPTVESAFAGFIIEKAVVEQPLTDKQIQQKENEIIETLGINNKKRKKKEENVGTTDIRVSKSIRTRCSFMHA